MKIARFVSACLAFVMTSGSGAHAAPVDLDKYFSTGNWAAVPDDGAAQAAAIPTPASQAVPGQSTKQAAAPPWQDDSRDICKIWTARNPKTADPDLCEFAARELHTHGIPWKVALANWDYASSLKPWMKYSAGGMTAEGLTDASWGFCRDHPEAVRGLLGREPRHSDMMNPQASILWWIAEYEIERKQLGDGDAWRVTRGIFYPAEPDGARARLEQRRWQLVAREHDGILS